jgi:hypothetical protein
MFTTSHRRRRRRRVFLLAIVLAGVTAIGCVAQPSADERSRLLWTRTELYLGRSIPPDVEAAAAAGGREVSAAEWERFMAEVVTPRFPDGLTIIDAVGQYRDAAVPNGGIVREPTKILLILHARDELIDESIDEIRREYAKRFRQKSVLKVTSPAVVKFESKQ